MWFPDKARYTHERMRPQPRERRSEMYLAPRIVIIHGSFGTPEENWFPWLASELRSDGCRVLCPRLPTPEGQNLSSWKDAFNAEVGPLSPDTVLVGHSLGPGFILNLLQDTMQTILGTFLVSGFIGKLGIEEFDRVNESFVCRDFDWKRIKRNAGFVHVYNSDNDPYVPLERGKSLADKLGVELTILHNSGHVNLAAGFDEFPQLLHDIRALLISHQNTTSN
jgi:predicted alpha/beta hydrolase family esterase